MATQQVVGNGSEVAGTQVATSTGTSGGSAGNNTTTGGTGSITSSTPVVAPKGFRSELQQMLQGWQEVIPSGSTFASSGGGFSQAAVLAKLQGYLGAYTDLDTNATAVNEARALVRVAAVGGEVRTTPRAEGGGDHLPRRADQPGSSRSSG